VNALSSTSATDWVTEPTRDGAGTAPARSGPAWFWRNRLKEAAFWLYLNCGYVALRDALLSACGRSRAIVVYYHRVGGCDRLTKSRDAFRDDLAYLKRHYECITLAELCDRLCKGVPIRRRCAVVTFDDGYRDNFTQAMPELLAAGVPATFFVATGFISTSEVFPHDLRAAAQDYLPTSAANFPKLTWDDLRAMEDGGLEIGSHTVHHTDLGAADEATVAAELTASLATIRRELADRPRAFSFPWGHPKNMSESALAAVKKAGYYAAASAFGGANTRGDDCFRLRRVDVGNGHLSRLAARAKMAGLDPDYGRLARKHPNV
jgi:peptidoglycan/xylan/chitin deacetylase (PgdA/CDA1 family)